MINPAYIHAIGIAWDYEFFPFEPEHFQDGLIKMNGDYSVATLVRIAMEVMADHKICGNGGVGCGKLFKNADVTTTHQYGQTYHWCKTCYPKIKDD